MWRWKNSPWRSGRRPALYGSVIVRFMSHLTYEIGALARTLEDVVEEPIDDLAARVVEDELLPALGPRTSGHTDGPVRVLLEQAAVLGDHLGFDPQTEPDAEFLHSLGQGRQPVGQLARIDEPVAERGRGVVPGAEPAVVEDEQLGPQIARRRRDRE